MQIHIKVVSRDKLDEGRQLLLSVIKNHLCIHQTEDISVFVMIITIRNNHGSYIICYISVCFFLYKYIDQYKKNQTILVEENFTWNSQWSLVACGEPRFIFKVGFWACGRASTTTLYKMI